MANAVAAMNSGRIMAGENSGTAGDAVGTASLGVGLCEAPGGKLGEDDAAGDGEVGGEVDPVGVELGGGEADPAAVGVGDGEGDGVGVGVVAIVPVTRMLSTKKSVAPPC